MARESKYTGVSWHIRRQRWVVQLYVNGKRQVYGSFKIERDAALAYDKQVIKLGLDRKLNILKRKQ